MTELLKDLAVPGPTTIALTEPFWQAIEAGRFILQHCGSCKRHIFYPRSLCPHCWSDDLTWVPGKGTGFLKSFSQVYKPAHPGWVPVAGYIVGLVELTEGPVMLSLILPQENRPLKTGDALRLHPTDVGGRILPVFKQDIQNEQLEDLQ